MRDGRPKFRNAAKKVFKAKSFPKKKKKKRKEEELQWSFANCRGTAVKTQAKSDGAIRKAQKELPNERPHLI